MHEEWTNKRRLRLADYGHHTEKSRSNRDDNNNNNSNNNNRAVVWYCCMCAVIRLVQSKRIQINQSSMVPPLIDPRRSERSTRKINTDRYWCCFAAVAAADRSTAVVAAAGVKRIDSVKWLIRNVVACCWSIRTIIGFAAVVSLLLLLLLQSALTDQTPQFHCWCWCSCCCFYWWIHCCCCCYRFGTMKDHWCCWSSMLLISSCCCCCCRQQSEKRIPSRPRASCYTSTTVVSIGCISVCP